MKEKVRDKHDDGQRERVDEGQTEVKEGRREAKR